MTPQDVCGEAIVLKDKHNVTLTSSLKVLQNKVAKIILDRPLYSSATHALATLTWVPLAKRHFQRCIFVYKFLKDTKNYMIITTELN